jgi:hypothetical protein
MKPIPFSEQTDVIAKDQPEYLPLPAHRVANDPSGRIVSCWKLTWRERLSILVHGVIWHETLTFYEPLQPQKLSARKPKFL